MNSQNTSTSPSDPSSSPRVAVIGGGPAGLMAAEVIASAGIAVDLFDAMPSVGRKFLLAGVGGMNITHAEEKNDFLNRYGDKRPQLQAFIDAFDAQALRDWIHGLGVDTFVGSSGRVFPRDMKAAPLLRAWLHRLRQLGVRFHPRHRWLGWNESGSWRLLDLANQREQSLPFAAGVLALGGGSWPRLGSDGSWVSLLAAEGIALQPLSPSNCGFELAWSDYIKSRFAGEPLHTIALSYVDSTNKLQRLRGEATLSEYGIEGGLIYAASAQLRAQLARSGSATVWLDLAPDLSAAQVAAKLQQPRGKDSFSNFLRKQLRLSPVKIALVREQLSAAQCQEATQLTEAVKGLRLTLSAPRPLAEAISSAGGVCFSALDQRLMLKQKPGVFCAGEMLDWEAPTGGYLLTACFATGRAVGQGVVEWLR